MLGHPLSQLLAFALTFSTSAAFYKGFNYGSTLSNGAVMTESDYKSQFATAKALVGAPGFTSARLYTSIQGGTSNSYSDAFPAAVAEDTSLLLGIWASSGQTTIDNELTAIKSAIGALGSSFTSRVVAISVGSEDLYRDSVIGQQNNAGVGAGPSTIVSYIKQVKSALSGTGLANVPIGHVDTWTAWVNSSNDAVISASDWIGMDAYPYFQNTMPNSISDGKSLFQSALQQTEAAANGKPVWITETGWPVSGATENLAVPSLKNAQTYWDEVGCNLLFGHYNTYWYTLQDANPVTPNPSFGVVGGTLSTTPLYNLSCSAGPPSSTSAVSSVSTVSSTSSTSTSVPSSSPVSTSVATVISVSSTTPVSSETTPVTVSSLPAVTQIETVTTYQCSSTMSTMAPSVAALSTSHASAVLTGTGLAHSTSPAAATFTGAANTRASSPLAMVGGLVAAVVAAL